MPPRSAVQLRTCKAIQKVVKSGGAVEQRRGLQAGHPAFQVIHGSRTIAAAAAAAAAAASSWNTNAHTGTDFAVKIIGIDSFLKDHNPRLPSIVDGLTRYHGHGDCTAWPGGAYTGWYANVDGAPDELSMRISIFDMISILL